MTDAASGPPPAFYHRGMRTVQQQMDSVRLADRLEQLTVHDRLSTDDKAFIESVDMVFVATADGDGFPDCSYKGGNRGFVRILSDTSLAIPSYDGNGQYRTLGNINQNPAIGLLFVDFERKKRTRVNGTAELVTSSVDQDFVASFPGAEAVIVVQLRHAFPNCPRYLHNVATGEPSEFAPAENYTPPQPSWKEMDAFKDALPNPAPRPVSPN